MASKGSDIHQDIFNEVDNKDPNKPDAMDGDLYYAYPEVIAMQTKESGNMVETPNSKASRDLYGGPTKGEPNPIGMKGN